MTRELINHPDPDDTYLVLYQSDGRWRLGRFCHGHEVPRSFGFDSRESAEDAAEVCNRLMGINVQIEDAERNASQRALANFLKMSWQNGVRHPKISQLAEQCFPGLTLAAYNEAADLAWKEMAFSGIKRRFAREMRDLDDSLPF